MAPRDCGAALLLLMERQQGAAARNFVQLMVQVSPAVGGGLSLGGLTLTLNFTL